MSKKSFSAAAEAWRPARLQTLRSVGREALYRDYPYLAWRPPYLAAACVRFLLFSEGDEQVGYSEISLQRDDGDEGQS